MFGDLLRKIGIGSGAKNGLADDDSVAFGISAAYHSRFLSECRQGLSEIRISGEQLQARKLKRALSQMCDSVNTIVRRCQDAPEAISDVRELPSTLRRIKDTIDEHAAMSSVRDPEDLARDESLMALVGALTKGFEQTAAGLTLGNRVNLSALTEVLGRIAARSRERSDLGANT